MDELDQLGWLVQGSFEIGNHLIGLRTNSHECWAWLSEMLSAYAVEEPADPYYSIYVPAANRTVGRGYTILYRESQALFRSFDQGTVAAALLSELDSYLHAQRDDALYLRYALVAREGVNALIPPDIVPYLATMGSRVSRAGVWLPSQVSVAIDLDTGAAYLPPLALQVNGVLPAEFGAGEPVAVDVICSTGLLDALVMTTSRGVIAHTLALRASNLRRLRGRGMSTIEMLVAGARCREMQSSDTRTTLKALCEAVSVDETLSLVRT